MPLQKLQLRPGISRESTSLTNEGTWYECDKVRFRSGSAEKIGGWVRDSGMYEPDLKPPLGVFWGRARAIWNWVATNGNNLLAIGSDLKYMIQVGVGGKIYDVTPLRLTTDPGDVTFDATTSSSIVEVTHTAHGAAAGDFVTFSGATTLGGAVTAAVLNAEFRIVQVTSADTYTIDVVVLATGGDTGDGGAAVVGEYQLGNGAGINAPPSGWGAGDWGGDVMGGSWGITTGAATYIETRLRQWSQSNYGDYLIFNVHNGPIYLWANNPLLRGVVLSNTSTDIYQTDAYCPSVCDHIMVSDSTRIVIAFGCNDLGTAVKDPMLIRWSDQEDYRVWYPQVTNQAGGYRLSHGSQIVTSLQTRQEILVWTDFALYSMQYSGPPYVWGFSILADNISVLGTNTVATASNIVYWMGHDKFYVYTGRVETLPCSLRQYVFGDLNLNQQEQFFAGTNESYNEIWWFYCSANSTTIDRYVIFNYVEKVWYYGTMERTAWLDSGLRQYPIALDYKNNIIYHEVGVDDATTFPSSSINAYIWSADIDIEDGHNFGFVWRILPDITFDGSTIPVPEVTFSLAPRKAAGAPYGPVGTRPVDSTQDYTVQRNYIIQQFTEIIYPRVRGRQMRFGVSSNQVGVKWQLGVPRVELRPDGRRG